MDVWPYPDKKHWGMVFLYDSELSLVEQRVVALAAPQCTVERLRVRNTTAGSPMEFAHEVEKFVLVAEARDPEGQWAAIYRSER